MKQNAGIATTALD